jgi:hypothetical protein
MATKWLTWTVLPHSTFRIPRSRAGAIEALGWWGMTMTPWGLGPAVVAVFPAASPPGSRCNVFNADAGAELGRHLSRTDPWLVSIPQWPHLHSLALPSGFLSCTDHEQSLTQVPGIQGCWRSWRIVLVTQVNVFARFFAVSRAR